MDSKAFLGLQSASSDVKKDTQNLVTSAQRALDIEKQNQEADAQNVVSSSRMNNDWLEELKLKEEIERSMREQEERYKQLKKIQENRYKKRETEEEQHSEANQNQYRRVTGHD